MLRYRLELVLFQILSPASAATGAGRAGNTAVITCYRVPEFMGSCPGHMLICTFFLTLNRISCYVQSHWSENSTEVQAIYELGLVGWSSEWGWLVPREVVMVVCTLEE